MKSLILWCLVFFFLILIGVFGYNAKTDAQVMLRHFIRDVAEICNIVKDEIKQEIK